MRCPSCEHDAPAGGRFCVHCAAPLAVWCIGCQAELPAAARFCPQYFATRIGLNSGKMVVGKIGDDLRMEYTAQGHTVGLAQWVESLAKADTCFLSNTRWHGTTIANGLRPSACPSDGVCAHRLDA